MHALLKTVHTLNNLDETELSKINDRNDGEVEVIDVKLNNRKTKKLVKMMKALTRKLKKSFLKINQIISKSVIIKI